MGVSFDKDCSLNFECKDLHWISQENCLPVAIDHVNNTSFLHSKSTMLYLVDMSMQHCAELLGAS